MLVLPALLTHDQAMATMAGLAAHIRPHAALNLNASALREFDSSALAVLLALLRQTQAQQGSLRIEGAPAKLQALAHLYGVDQVLGLAPR